MTKRILALALGLGLLCGLAVGEVRGTTVSATATSQTLPLGVASEVVIYNAGANEIYYRLFYDGEPPAAASTATGLYLASGSSIPYGPPRLYGSISIVCDTAETATVYLYYQ